MESIALQKTSIFLFFLGCIPFYFIALAYCDAHKSRRSTFFYGFTLIFVGLLVLIPIEEIKVEMNYEKYDYRTKYDQLNEKSQASYIRDEYEELLEEASQARVNLRDKSIFTENVFVLEVLVLFISLGVGSSLMAAAIAAKPEEKDQNLRQTIKNFMDSLKTSSGSLFKKIKKFGRKVLLLFYGSFLALLILVLS